jgi:uncharacterized membrane protein YbhN (UPF0104 family)
LIEGLAAVSTASISEPEAESAKQATTPKSVLSRLWSGPAGKGLRVLLAILPLGYLAKKLDLSLVVSNAGRVGASGVLLSVAFMLVSITLAAVRWRVLLASYGASAERIPSVFGLFKAYLVGLYFNVLPSGVAGDVVRGWRVASCVASATTSYVVLLLERLSGLIGLLTIALLSALSSPERAMKGALGYALGVGALGAVALATVFFALPQLREKSAKLTALVEKLPVVGPMLAKIPAASSGRGPALALALSVIIQGLIVASVAPLLMPLSERATVTVCGKIVPAVILVTYIPLTPGGLGQREAAFAHFFGAVGVPREASVTASLLFFAVMLAMSLLGGLVLAVERVTARRGDGE